MRALARGVAAVAGILLAVAAGAARAHPMDVAYAEVALHRADVEMALTVSLFELDLLLGLDRDRNGVVDEAEVAAGRPRIVEYLRDHVSVESSDARLPVDAAGIRPGRGADGRPILEAELRFSGRQDLSDVAIRCELLRELGPGHRTLARVDRAGAAEPFVFEPGAVYHARAPGRAPVLALVRLGIAHIFTGYDHLAFLLGLLLVSATFTEVLKIVTSFTVAHSVTLTLATLGVVSLPPRLIEAGIAASICYVAFENLARARLERRWLVSFGFGLVHGFGFANVVAELRLPRAGLAASLLAFNVGVELGQVAVVLAMLPVLGLVRRTRAARPVITSASAAILAVGAFWLYQRVR